MAQIPRMEVTETSEFTPTSDEVVRVCDRAWAQVQEMRKTRGLTRVSTMSDEDREHIEREIYEALLDDYRELCTTYPTVVAAMVVGSYSRKAVIKFFKYVRDHPWKGHDEFMDVQSAYSAILMRQLAREQRVHYHINSTEVARVRDYTREELKKAHDKMHDDIDRATKAATEINERRARARIDDLRTRVCADAPILIDGEVRPIVVSFDDM